MLEQQGLQLADSDVQQQSGRQADQDEGQTSAIGHIDGEMTEQELQDAQQAAAQLTVNSPYTVDYFA